MQSIILSSYRFSLSKIVYKDCTKRIPENNGIYPADWTVFTLFSTLSYYLLPTILSELCFPKCIFVNTLHSHYSIITNPWLLKRNKLTNLNELYIAPSGGWFKRIAHSHTNAISYSYHGIIELSLHRSMCSKSRSFSTLLFTSLSCLSAYLTVNT